MKRKLIATASVIVAATLFLVLTGFIASFKFGKRSGADDIPVLEERSGTITVWWPGSDTERKAIDKAASDYTALYPEVTINVIGQQTADFYSAYTLACAGNSAPDIAYIDHVFVQALAFEGYIANFTSAGYEDLEELFVPSLWTPGFYNEKLYALPMSANVLATVYNKTLIARAQNTTTDNIRLPQNYDEFVTLCGQITALNDETTQNDPYYGLTLPSGSGNNSMAAMSFLGYVNRCGGEGILSGDLQTSLLEGEASISAAQKIFKLGEYCPASFSEAVFEKGKIGFIEMGPWKIADYESYSQRYGWEVGYTTALPFTEGGNRGAAIGLYDLVVTNKQSEPQKMALAADFAKFVTTNDEYQLMFATPQNLIPATQTAGQDSFYSGEVWQVYIEQLRNGVARPGSPVWSSIESTLGNFVTKLVQQKFRNEKDVAMNCIAYSAQIQEALDDIYGGNTEKEEQ
ncbi:MAG: extracellular solute-binding protein [Clostridia bacterium]|nr:extracellular solute-binding protein [Clostridia bacterium]